MPGLRIGAVIERGLERNKRTVLTQRDMEKNGSPVSNIVEIFYNLRPWWGLASY